MPPDVLETMLTALLQILVALLTLAFAALALAVARLSPPPLAPRGHGAAWRLAGAAFAVLGVHSLVSSLAAAWALRLGPGSALHQAYVGWRPMGNYQRGFVLLGFGAALLLLAAGAWRRPARQPWRMWAGLLLCLGAGTLVWALEPPPAPGREVLVISIVHACTVLVLLAALVAAAARDAADRLLWLVLSAFTLRAALDVSLMAAREWSGAGQPPLAPRTLLLLTAAVYAAMVAVSWWRLRLARRGTHVPPLLEPLWPRRRVPVVR